MKSKAALFSVLFLFVFITCAYSQPVIKSGKFTANTETPGFNLAVDSGLRSFEIEVTFDQEFSVRPEVILSTEKLDADKDTNMRYSLEVKALNREGFIVKVSTWGDSKLFGISGSWLAYTK